MAEVVKVVTEKAMNDAFSVRKTVFIEEQNVPAEIEIDEHEKDAVHFVLYDHAKPVGAGRMRVLDGLGKAERICILAESRGTGGGKLIMEALEEHAGQLGLSKVKLNAQLHAVPFYEKLGYEIISEEFLDAGIPHRTMIKHL